MTKIAMFGGNGRIGKELQEYGVIHMFGDVRDIETINATVRMTKPDIIINLACKSDVDWCERKENMEDVISTNLIGMSNVLDAADLVGAKVVTLSTDHVFGGGNRPFSKKGPYSEKDTPAPVNFYGMSKFAAEALQEVHDNFYVVRTSYLFDWDRIGFDKDTVPPTYPDFIYRSFQYLPHFISNFYMYLSNLDKMPKFLHLAGSMTVSWYGFMRQVLGKQAEKRTHNLSMENPAPRPLWGGLRSNYKLFPSYSFLDGIEQMKKDMK